MSRGPSAIAALLVHFTTTSKDTQNSNDLKEFGDKVHLTQLVNKVLGDVECNGPHQQHVLLAVYYCPAAATAPQHQTAKQYLNTSKCVR